MENYRYRKTSYRCSTCKKQFDKIRKFSVVKYPHGIDLPLPKTDPECPFCEKDSRVRFKSSITDDIHKHISPEYVPDPNDKRVFSLGKSNFTKAMDATAEIVMKDYGLTNLQDNLREGDSMAPKLRHDLEQKVDSVFKPQKPIMGQKGASNLNTALTAQINSGRYSNQTHIRDVAAQAQSFGQARADATGQKVPTQVIMEHTGKPN